MTFIYQVFGLNFSTPLQFPNLFPCLQTEKFPPQVEIFFKKIPFSTSHLPPPIKLDRLSFCIGLDDAGNLTTWLEMEAVARYYIVGGRQIWVEALPEASTEDVFSYLWSLGVVCLLFQRSELVLHAGAVAFEGEGYVILGDSGAGKTSTVAKFKQQGGQVLAEDSTLITFQDEKPLIWSGLPYLKLWQPAAATLRLNWDDLSPLFSTLAKRAWVVPNFKPQAVPLKKIIWLKIGESTEITVTPLNLEQTFHALGMNIQYPDLFLEFDMDEICTQIAFQLARQIPCFVIERPAHIATLEQIVEVIKNI